MTYEYMYTKLCQIWAREHGKVLLELVLRTPDGEIQTVKDGQYVSDHSKEHWIR